MTPTRFDRLELKYVIDAAQRRAVRRALDGRATVDGHGDAEGRYPVISHYYDNAARELFWERERGHPSRRKLRIRLYGGQETSSQPACFVEVKHNVGGRVAKRRARLPITEAVSVCEGRATAFPVPAEQRPVLDEVRRMVIERDLRPVVALRYERQAFRGDRHWPDLRVTFDEHVVAGARHVGPRPGDRDFDLQLLPEGMSVLEIKVAYTTPRWLAEAVADAGCLLRPHSKYASAMSALEPELPTQPRPLSRRVPREGLARPLPAPMPQRVAAAAPYRSEQPWIR